MGPALPAQPLLVARPETVPKLQRGQSRKIDATAKAQALHSRAVGKLHTHGDLEGALAALVALLRDGSVVGRETAANGLFSRAARIGLRCACEVKNCNL